jgi:hypothetical protein
MKELISDFLSSSVGYEDGKPCLEYEPRIEDILSKVLRGAAATN